MEEVFPSINRKGESSMKTISRDTYLMMQVTLLTVRNHHNVPIYNIKEAKNLADSLLNLNKTVVDDDVKETDETSNTHPRAVY